MLLKKIVIFFLFQLINSFSLYACNFHCQGCTLPFIKNDFNTHSLKWKTKHNLCTPVNFVKTKSNLYILTDYASLLSFDLESENIWPLNLEGITKEELHPTGITYSKKLDVFFVANYHKKNILIFKLSSDGSSAILINKITNPNFKGPEGVTYSEHDGLLYVADHDSNLVLSIRITPDDLVMRNKEIVKNEVWSQKSNIPHGISAGEKYLFVASIADRSVTILDLKTGSKIKTFGKLGTEACNMEFLWPAFVYELDQERIIVTDGHTGYVKIINWVKETVETVFGGNGPGKRFFHNPGGVVIDNDFFYLISIYQYRIVKVNRQNMMLTDEFLLDTNRPNWEWFNGFDYDKFSLKPHIQNWGINQGVYQHKTRKINLFGDNFYMGYGAINLESPKAYGITSLRMPYSDGEFGNYGGYIYFMDYINLPNGYFLFSYASGYTLMLFYYNNFIQLFPIFSPQSYIYWNLYDTPISPYGPTIAYNKMPIYSLGTYYASIAESINSMSVKDTIKLLVNLITKDIMLKSTSQTMSDEQLIAEAKKWFITENGLEFYKVLSNNLNEESLIKEAAANYFNAIKKMDNIITPFSEIALVSMLSKTYIPLNSPSSFK